MCPSSTRNVSGNALQIGKEWTIIDCGEATQHQILKTRISPGNITRIFITHLHGDHCFGLPGLMCMINNACNNLQDKKILQIVGPKGLRNMVRAALLSSGLALSFHYRVDELWSTGDHNIILNKKDGVQCNKLQHYSAVFEVPFHPSELPGENMLLHDDGTWILPPHPSVGSIASDWTLQAAPLVHSIESVGYVFDEHPHRGKIDAAQLKERIMTEENKLYQSSKCGISNPLTLLGRLQRGESIQIQENGNLIKLTPGQFMTPPVRGRKIVVLGDTCDSRYLARLAANADVLVHEATNADVDPGEEEGSVLEIAVSRGHSTPAMAGTFAKCCGVDKLVLTHFSSRYKGDVSEESIKVMDLIGEKARDCFEGDIITARDFMEIPIPIHRKEENEKCSTIFPDFAAKAAAEAADFFLEKAGVC